jgi:Photoprotection regulator fluorescence recovery protein
MQLTDTEWSQAEQQVAENAFKKAYEREIDALINEVRSQASNITGIDDMWRLHDFLSGRRHAIDGKYDYRYSMLLFVFADLVKEGWLRVEELEGLEKSKLAKIAALSRM